MSPSLGVASTVHEGQGLAAQVVPTPPGVPPSAVQKEAARLRQGVPALQQLWAAPGVQIHAPAPLHAMVPAMLPGWMVHGSPGNSLAVPSFTKSTSSIARSASLSTVSQISVRVTSESLQQSTPPWMPGFDFTTNFDSLVPLPLSLQNQA